MFFEGDTIKVDKAEGRHVIAKILDIRYSAGAYTAKVFREDKQIEDVFVWNIHQNGISVHKLEPEIVLTMTQKEFVRRIADATSAGYTVGYQTGYEVCEAKWIKSEYEGVL